MKGSGSRSKQDNSRLAAISIVAVGTTSWVLLEEIRSSNFEESTHHTTVRNH